MTHKYGAAFLFIVYLAFGIEALAPPVTMPIFENVSYKECHTTCVKNRDGSQVCTRRCHTEQTIIPPRKK
jgi:hypothetical protein